MSASDNKRLKSPSAARNRAPVLAVLREHLPTSGSGEHGIHAARSMPGWQWQPSDVNPDALASITAWREHMAQQHGACENLLAPVALDVNSAWPAGWQGAAFDAIVAINLIHISPWHVTQTLMQRASEYLSATGVLFLYGPYRRHDQHTASSNEAFDADLKARDSSWGLRDLECVEAEAAASGLVLERVVEMPANNLSVIFRRRAD
ncbi:MAG: class I SAM-dependent methyltransferase [Halomonas sp.]|nr:DUF938 domain-containing protein [Halomonas sp.]MDN6297335.1 class I SAM-dependent methyltransferase [Halomonas sp.]MDN6315088.1 class I SAM-dependent methyltransferase [Halomonas sp.]MDN6337118.1 class I SAM-dependent methyltransferase [Halomonas sp.]